MKKKKIQKKSQKNLRQKKKAQQKIQGSNQQASSHPEYCDETNCTCIFEASYTKGEPYSGWCHGVRTGIIKGKEKALETTPKDVFVACILLGSHSDDEGRYCFVQCLADYPLQIKEMFIAMYKTGMRHQFKDIFWSLSDEIITLILDAIPLDYQKKKAIDIGSKFIEFTCDCGEVFFREYNHDHGDNYYVPNELDIRLFDFHRRLGHRVLYRKCKRVRHSKVGKNKFWQEWGPYEWISIES